VIFDGGGLAGHTVGYIVKYAIACEINHETDDKGKRETDGYHLWPHDKSTGGSSGGVKAEGYLYLSAFKNPDFWSEGIGKEFNAEIPESMASKSRKISGIYSPIRRT
jgi:hypothetical protein